MRFEEKYGTDKSTGVVGDISYRTYFGDAITFTYNGLLVRLELDGTTQYFPDFIAKEIEKRKQRVVTASLKVKDVQTLKKLNL